MAAAMSMRLFITLYLSLWFCCWVKTVSCTDPSQWQQNTPMCNEGHIQAQAPNSTALFCAGMKSFNYNAEWDGLIVYNFIDVNTPSRYLFNAGTTPKDGHDNYLFLYPNGTLRIYSTEDKSVRREWDLPAGSNAVQPFYLQISVDAALDVSLRVYGHDMNTGETIIAYSVFPPSS